MRRYVNMVLAGLAVGTLAGCGAGPIGPFGVANGCETQEDCLDGYHCDSDNVCRKDEIGGPSSGLTSSGGAVDGSTSTGGNSTNGGKTSGSNSSGVVQNSSTQVVASSGGPSSGLTSSSGVVSRSHALDQGENYSVVDGVDLCAETGTIAEVQRVLSAENVEVLSEGVRLAGSAEAYLVRSSPLRPLDWQVIIRIFSSRSRGDSPVQVSQVKLFDADNREVAQINTAQLFGPVADGSESNHTLLPGVDSWVVADDVEPVEGSSFTSVAKVVVNLDLSSSQEATWMGAGPVDVVSYSVVDDARMQVVVKNNGSQILQLAGEGHLALYLDADGRPLAHALLNGTETTLPPGATAVLSGGRPCSTTSTRLLVVANYRRHEFPTSSSSGGDTSASGNVSTSGSSTSGFIPGHDLDQGDNYSMVDGSQLCTEAGTISEVRRVISAENIKLLRTDGPTKVEIAGAVDGYVVRTSSSDPTWEVLVRVRLDAGYCGVIVRKLIVRDSGGAALASTYYADVYGPVGDSGTLSQGITDNNCFLPGADSWITTSQPSALATFDSIGMIEVEMDLTTPAVPLTNGIVEATSYVKTGLSTLDVTVRNHGSIPVTLYHGRHLAMFLDAEGLPLGKTILSSGDAILYSGDTAILTGGRPCATTSTRLLVIANYKPLEQGTSSSSGNTYSGFSSSSGYQPRSSTSSSGGSTMSSSMGASSSDAANSSTSTASSGTATSQVQSSSLAATSNMPAGSGEPYLNGTFTVVNSPVLDTINVAATFTQVPVKAYFPGNAPGAHPLVLINHGFQISIDKYLNYAVRLASHGFIAVLVDYKSAMFGVDHVKNTTEILAVIDWALAQTAFTVDPAKIGIMGHSLGGKLSFQAAASDVRIKAVLGLDPVDGAQGCDATKCPDVTDMLDSFTIPSAVLGETLDTVPALPVGGVPACTPAEHNFATFYDQLPTPSLKVTVNEAGHMSFLDNTEGCLSCAVCQTGTNKNDVVSDMARSFMVAFFRKHLMGENNYDTYLTGDEANNRYVTPGIVTIEFK